MEIARVIFEREYNGPGPQPVTSTALYHIPLTEATASQRYNIGVRLFGDPRRREAALGHGGTEFSVTRLAGGIFNILGSSPNLGDFDRHAAVRHEPWGCGYSWSGGAGLDQTKGNLRFRSPSA